MTIQDDGVGVTDRGGRSGLENLAHRAAAHGGTFSISARTPNGTLLRWRVPLR